MTTRLVAKQSYTPKPYQYSDPKSYTQEMIKKKRKKEVEGNLGKSPQRLCGMCISLSNYYKLIVNCALKLTDRHTDTRETDLDKKTDRETHRQTDRDKNRKTGRDRNIQRERVKERERDGGTERERRVHV